MYLEEELFNWIENRVRKSDRVFNFEDLRDIVEDVGVWYSFEGIRYEVEDPEMTLEDCFREYWWIIDGNSIRFTNADSFSENLDEYLGL